MNPNINNELESEEENRTLIIPGAFGRSSYASVFHSLFETVEQYIKQFEDEEMDSKRYRTKCVQIIVKHKADPSINISVWFGGLKGNVKMRFLISYFKLDLTRRRWR